MDSTIAALLMLLIMIWGILALTVIFAILKVKRMVRNAFSLVFTFTLKPKFRSYRR